MKIDHFGFVVENLDDALGNYPLHKLINRVKDPIQMSDLALIESDNGCALELICPEKEVGTTWNFLQKTGGGFHHVCYLIPNEDMAALYFETFRCVRVSAWVAATLFDGRVCFGVSKNRGMIELRCL